MQNMNASKYINTSSLPPLTKEDEKELFLTINSVNSNEKEKQAAIDKICLSHIRFISGYAHYFAKKCPVDIEDLIGAGVEGVMEAIVRYDINAKNRFAAYCGWWIRLKIIKCVQKNYPVAIPQNVMDDMIRLQKVMKDDNGTLLREEIAESMNISEKRLLEVEAARVTTISINSEIFNNKRSQDIEFSYENILSDPFLNPYEKVEHNDLALCLEEILSEMDEKSVELIMSKYGENKVRLQDLASKYGVTQERIRQMRVDAVKEVSKRLIEKST